MLLPTAFLSSLSVFSPMSGRRQACPLRAFKRLLKVLSRRGPYPPAADRAVHPRRPRSPLSNHSFSGCQLALLLPPPLRLRSGLTHASGSGAKRGHSLVAAMGETGHLRHTDLRGPFEGSDVTAWAVNDAESNALIHFLGVNTERL